MNRENKMGVMSVKKLVITMSLPMMISMLVQALYNVVDSIFVSQVCEDALTAVSLAFPAQNLMIGVATGTGVGVNALLSRSLGEKNFEKANKIAAQGVLLAMLSSVLFALFGLFGTKIFFAAQVEKGSAIYNYGVDYLSVVCIVSVGLFGQVIMERLMQATGKTTLSMSTQLIGAIANIILDPLFILGIGPFPRLEAKGAAVATVIGQILAFIAGVILNERANKEINLRFSNLRPDLKIIGDIYKIGIPSVLMVGIGSLMTFFLNKILLSFTTTAAAVFGVYFKLQSFIFMPIFGLNNGVIPIIAYNYGARKKERITECLRFSCLIAVSIMALGTVLMWLMPEQMLRLFDAKDEMMELGVPALKIISTSFVLAGVCINLGSAFQALGKSYFSMIISFCRQIVVLLPSAYLLSKTGVLNNVWFAFPIAEVMSLTVTAVSFLYVYRKIIKPISFPENTEKKA
ncbi:MAG: MATE family efflux transporter [Ruminococcaceae bacterium]|nr:MATE family efflux transporter [Oscillospiraceae bacterium]